MVQLDSVRLLVGLYLGVFSKLNVCVKNIGWFYVKVSDCGTCISKLIESELYERV